jgi:hypothetical protein
VLLVRDGACLEGVINDEEWLDDELDVCVKSGAKLLEVAKPPREGVKCVVAAALDGIEGGALVFKELLRSSALCG